MSIANADPLLSRRQAADYINVKYGTLGVWASTKRYRLPFIRVGRDAKYRKSALDNFLAEREISFE